jgi:hypothetical protein
VPSTARVKPEDCITSPKRKVRVADHTPYVKLTILGVSRRLGLLPGCRTSIRATAPFGSTSGR